MCIFPLPSSIFSGSFTHPVTDQVSLGGHLTLKDQSIGVASKATGFHGVDGILG
jgi:hypothetical protein